MILKLNIFVKYEILVTIHVLKIKIALETKFFYVVLHYFIFKVI